MSNFVIQGYANLENVNANNMDLFYATMSAQLSTFFPTLAGTQGSICHGIGNIVGKYGQVAATNVFNFTTGAIRFLDQVTNLTTDVSIKPCYANYTAASVTVTCPISVTQYYVVALMSFNTPTDPFTTSTSVVISPTAMTLAQIAAEPVPELYNPLFAITTVDGTNYTIHIDGNCAFNYGYIIGNPFPDITDVAGLVSIIGGGGLSVNNTLSIGGNLNVALNAGITGGLNVGAGLGVTGAAIINGPITGASISVALVGGRGSLNAFANGANTTYLGSIVSVGGTIDNGLNFNDTVGRPVLNSPATAITSVFELACINDINGAISITQQFIGSGTTGGTFSLTATTSNGGFPCTTGVNLSGEIHNGVSAAPGTYFTFQIDLAGNGILGGSAALTNVGSGMGGALPIGSGGGFAVGAAVSCGPASSILTLDGLVPATSPGSIDEAVSFNIIVK